VPPTCRSEIPLRSLIHSSDVSRVRIRSAFVTTRGGRALPQPVMIAPRAPIEVAGTSGRPQPSDRLTGRDALAVDGDVGLKNPGESRQHIDLADRADDGSDFDVGAGE
ncbi:MAG: hypothetical protein RLZZ128_955, partial [Actinomycetota bacterium]